MLSDFGTSRDMLHSSRTRSGNTGTYVPFLPFCPFMYSLHFHISACRLEYTAPESLPAPHTGLLHQVDSKADMWSLGMVLHKLLLFRLPYRYAEEAEDDGGRRDTGEQEKMVRLEREIQAYPGCAIPFTVCKRMSGIVAEN